MVLDPVQSIESIVDRLKAAVERFKQADQAYRSYRRANSHDGAPDSEEQRLSRERDLAMEEQSIACVELLRHNRRVPSDGDGPLPS